MLKRYRAISYLAIMLLFLICLGCSEKAESEEKIAYISANKDSTYTKTFKDLNLGILYDFNFRLTEADTSWVTFWVEGYQNGEKTDPFRLIELSYGLNPDKLVEGQLGFGIINPRSEENASFFLYSPNVYTTPQSIENLLNSEGVMGSSWDFAIGEEELGLEAEEAKILGVYRETGNSVRTYDYQDMNHITQMINEDKTVLLLKIKVERNI